MNTRPVRMRAALAVEGAKFTHARVPVVTAAMIVGGVSLIGFAITHAARAGDAATMAKFGQTVADGGWSGLLSTAGQVSAVGGLLGFGVVAAWTVGREFSDGTVSGLFGLAVSRGEIAVAKLVAFLLWSLVTGAALVAALTVTGLAMGLGLPGGAAGMLLKQFVLTCLTALLAVPAAVAATIARTVLGGIATVILIVVAAQVAVISGAGGWFPFAAPGLWWVAPHQVSALQLLTAVPVAVLAGAVTVGLWSRLQLDR